MTPPLGATATAADVEDHALQDSPVEDLGRHALVYVRVSTKEQAERDGDPEGYSIPAQREACNRKAEGLGAMVVEEFVDRGESARSADRPELQRMLRYVRKHDVDYVIVHKVDRLARSRYDDVTITAELKAAGVQLVSVTENIDETPSGVLLHGIMSSIAEFYSRNLATEVIKGSVQKAKGGGTVGKAPTGYRNVGKVENGREVRTVEVDPDRAPHMQWAFEAYATGEWTVRHLTAELSRRGLTSAPGPNRPPKPLSVSNVHRLLTHPYYMGIVRYRDKVYAGRHEPLVSEETWSRVQAVLRSQNLAGDKKRKHPHYLTGSVFCGNCHSRLLVTRAKGRRGEVYPYFICLGRHQKRTDCQFKAVLIDHVEALVEEEYERVQADLRPEWIAKLREVLSADMETFRTHVQFELAQQTKRIDRLNAERKKLLQAHYADAIPFELFREEQARISQEVDDAEARLAVIRKSPEHSMQDMLDALIELVRSSHDTYLKAAPMVRRLFNQAFFERLEVAEDGQELTLTRLAAPIDLIVRPQQVEVAGHEEAPAETRNGQGRGDVDIYLVGGLNLNLMVGAEGLEPPTPSL
jgi:site-specific DNA recombinase